MGGLCVDSVCGVCMFSPCPRGCPLEASIIGLLSSQCPWTNALMKTWICSPQALHSSCRRGRTKCTALYCANKVPAFLNKWLAASSSSRHIALLIFLLCYQRTPASLYTLPNTSLSRPEMCSCEATLANTLKHGSSELLQFLICTCFPPTMLVWIKSRAPSRDVICGSLRI